MASFPIDDLIRLSSLGDRRALRVRSRTPPEHAEEIVERSKRTRVEKIADRHTSPSDTNNDKARIGPSSPPRGVLENRMTVYVTAVHMSGGSQHEHISEVKWQNPQDGATGSSTRDVMVNWINTGGVAKVSDGVRSVEVGVVKVAPPYLRTHADGRWTDNLLALPRY